MQKRGKDRTEKNVFYICALAQGIKQCAIHLSVGLYRGLSSKTLHFSPSYLLITIEH